MRRLGVVTTSRADYGIYRPLLEHCRATEEIRARLIVTGTHLSDQHGKTLSEIDEDGFEIAAKSEITLAASTARGVVKAGALAELWFADLFASRQFDILVVLGDRYEMHAAAVAALPFTLPVAHIHGGEITEGAIDDSIRHSITKLSHLHFTSTERYAARIRQLGEEAWRVHTSGALSLDNVRCLQPYDRASMKQHFGVELADDFLLVTFHPATLEFKEAGAQTRELLMALGELGLPVLFTMPNADVGSGEIRSAINEYVRTHRCAAAVESLGMRGYLSAVALSRAVVGNSSSGIVEAGLLGRPVVNIGTRQDGRVRGSNVVDCGYSRDEIIGALRKALSGRFLDRIRGASNPYGDGRAAERIASVLASVQLDDRLLRKKFADNTSRSRESTE